MSNYTSNLNLFKYDPINDAKEPFNIEKCLNENWDKLDQKVGISPVGQPQITLSNTLEENEIWLEGAEVSRITYSELFAIYGTTYGEGDGSITFNLPDFRNRAIWGSDSFGYLEAGLPDHYHRVGARRQAYYPGAANNAIYTDGTLLITNYASASNPIYGKSNTVQPPSIKVRVKTRYI